MFLVYHEIPLQKTDSQLIIGNKLLALIHLLKYYISPSTLLPFMKPVQNPYDTFPKISRN